jgi:hypothetical protein
MPRGAGEDKGAVSQLERERKKKKCGIISSSLAESSPLSDKASTCSFGSGKGLPTAAPSGFPSQAC